MNPLRKYLSTYWNVIQRSLFSDLEEELGELTEKHRQLVQTLEMLRIEDHIPRSSGMPWRPPKSRTAIARAFVAKMVYNLPTTRDLLERLRSDPKLRRICGWRRAADVPSESTFSRAFAEFAHAQLPAQVQQARLSETHTDRLVGHVSRDATAIPAREKPAKKPKAAPKPPKRKPGRPKKGDERPKEPTRLERQRTMTLEQCLEDLPKSCDVGTKQNSKGKKESWIGYSLHIDAADGQIPISCILTSASMHDSQAAIPLAKMTAARVTNLYDLMDSAYDATEIREHSRSLGHVPIIDVNPRNNKALKEEIETETKRLRLLHFKRPEAVRYNERSASERVNGRLKDEFGGRTVRVRGHAKVFCHLLFGILALTADQLFRLTT